MKKKVFVLISYCLVALLFASTETSCLLKENTGQFVLINSSNEMITQARIEVCEQLIEVNNIEPHEKYNGTYKIKSDSHYDVTISFASGKELRDKLGYVTHGFDFTHTITITDSTISINNTQVE